MIGFIILAVLLLVLLIALIGYAKSCEPKVDKVPMKLHSEPPLFWIENGPNGGYIIVKGVWPFLTCTGSRADVEHIADLLNEDRERMMKK